MTKRTVEIWVAMNENGDYEASADQDNALEFLDENFGGVTKRLVKIMVTMSAPVVVEASVTINDEAGEIVAAAD